MASFLGCYAVEYQTQMRSLKILKIWLKFPSRSSFSSPASKGFFPDALDTSLNFFFYWSIFALQSLKFKVTI